MTAKERRDYIAIQILGSLVHDESMAVEQAIASEDIHESESAEWLDDITKASVIIANKMVEQLRDIPAEGDES